MNDAPKRFDDFQDVDCNQCARYWDSSCDSAGDVRRPCKSYLATRNVVIPLQIKALQKGVERLSWLCVILYAILTVHLLVSIFR